MTNNLSDLRALGARNLELALRRLLSGIAALTGTGATLVTQSRPPQVS
jgi:hypothetical protein